MGKRVTIMIDDNIDKKNLFITNKRDSKNQ